MLRALRSEWKEPSVRNHALFDYGIGYQDLKDWVDADGATPISPKAKNSLGALAELVAALHLCGRLVGHGAGHDVNVAGVTYEVRTRSNGGRPDYSGKKADHFVDVKFVVDHAGLRAAALETRVGTPVVNDGTDPWTADVSFRPVLLLPRG